MRKLIKNMSGFTLIELIGVIVIMGIILVVVMPSMNKMINNNDNEEYENYYNLIHEGAEVYSGTLTDKIGGPKNSGCAEITLSELIDGGYIKEFNDKEVTCKTGLGNIKVRNEMGNISINFQLECIKGKDSFVMGTNDSNTCNAYVMATETTLKSNLENLSSSSTQTINNEVYMTGSNVNNYIWYSGKLWRAVSYDKITETVKAVTADSIISLYYNHNDSSAYSGSDVEMWLNDDFLNSLKDYQNFIVSSNWNSTPNSNVNNNLSSNDKIKRAKVGLINTYELGRINNWYNSGTNNYTWLLSEGNNGNSLYSNNGTVTSTSSKAMYGVRPAVTFAADVLVYSGTGTSTNPYIIDNSSNAFGSVGDYLNTRYSGEYISLGGKKYRIISTDGTTTKVIGTTKVGDYMYSDNHFDYSASSLHSTLESDSLFNSNLIVKGDFCTDTINNSPALYQSSKCLVPSRVNNSIRIGIPKVGEFYTTGINGVGEYWTLNPNTEIDSDGNNYNATMNVITENGIVSTSIISSTKSTVVVFYLDSETVISGGKGTENNPYSIKK